MAAAPGFKRERLYTALKTQRKRGFFQPNIKSLIGIGFVSGLFNDSLIFYAARFFFLIVLSLHVIR